MNDETVTKPALESLSDIALTYSQPGDGEVQFTAGNLVMDGFHTASQNQLYLRFRTTEGNEEQIGLVIATRLP